MHPILHAPAARALALGFLLVALASAGAAAGSASPMGAGERDATDAEEAAGTSGGRLVDATPPAGLRSLVVEAKGGKASVDALLPEDDDVVQAKFLFVDDAGAELARLYAPAGPGERVLLQLDVPPGATTLRAGAVDGEGNAGPATSAPVDGRLAVHTIEPREAPLAPLLAGLGALAGAVAARRR